MTDNPPESKSSLPLRLIGWVLGAMSFLNLVQDIGKMAVIGKLKVWLDAYTLLVNKAGDFLFAWIHLGWISISPEEHHVLVLSAVFCAAVFRAEYSNQRQKHNASLEDAAVDASLLALLYFLHPFVPALLLPGYWGLAGAAFGLMFALGVSFTISGIVLAAFASVRRELIGVLGVFVVLVALNYSIFRADGG